MTKHTHTHTYTHIPHSHTPTLFPKPPTALHFALINMQALSVQSLIFIWASVLNADRSLGSGCHSSKMMGDFHWKSSLTLSISLSLGVCVYVASLSCVRLSLSIDDV